MHSTIDLVDPGESSQAHSLLSPASALLSLSYDSPIAYSHTSANAPAFHMNNNSTPGKSAERVYDEFQQGLSHSATAVNSGADRSQGQYLGSSSVQVFTQWLDVSCHAHTSQERSLASRFVSGKKHSVEMELPLQVQLEPLPDYNSVSAYLDTYFHRTNCLFPIVDKDGFQLSFHRLATMRDVYQIDPSDLPLLTCAYVVLCISMDEDAGQITPAGTRYLQMAYSLYGHLIATPYISSIQALLLIVIALRSRNKDGAAWFVVGLAVRVAQAAGLHRFQSANHSPIQGGGNGNELRRRIWWTAYVLEKILAFESGRPSMIVDADIDQSLPREEDGETRYLHAIVKLIAIQSQITTKLFHINGAHRSPETLNQDTASIDRSLQDWNVSLPDELRPERCLAYASIDCIYPAAYIAFLYHETVITLHRLALILDTRLYHRHINEHSKDDRIRFTLYVAESTAINSAKALLGMINEMHQRHNRISLMPLSPALLAICALAMQLLKQPNHWNSKSDLLLLESAASRVETSYKEAGIGLNFASIIRRWLLLSWLLNIVKLTSSFFQYIQRRSCLH